MADYLLLLTNFFPHARYKVEHNQEHQQNGFYVEFDNVIFVIF